MRPFVRLAIFGAVLIGLSACDAAAPRQDISEIELMRLEGGSDRLSQWRGKIVILNVWATWCAPCRAEMPALQALSDALDPATYAVLGVSIDKASFPVKEYLRERGIVFAQHIDIEGRMTRDVLGVGELPQTLIIDSEGFVLDRIKGARAWNANDIIAKFPKMGN
ncbi:MAG: TlpA family protein disulfide reductase [Magnetovibrio sp.]|nr:TlpA family protein disulfide reductase [Magnetovibrio sp.]